MRNRRINHPVMVLVATLMLAPVAALGQMDGIRWRNNLDVAKIEAAQSNRLVLLHFWSSGCAPCLKLEQNVFAVPQVGSAIEQNFVPVKVNADVSPALSYMYRIDRVPIDIVLTPQGSVVTTLSCPPTADAYVAQLSNAASHYNQQIGKSAAAGQAQVNAAYVGLPAQQPSPQIITPAQSTVPGQPPAANADSAYGVNNQPSAQVSPQAQVSLPAQVAPQAQANSNPATVNSTANTTAVPANAMPRSYRNQYVESQYAGSQSQSATLATATPTTQSTVVPSQSAANPATNNSVTPSQSVAPPQSQAAAAVASQAATTQAAIPNPIQLPAGSPPLGFDGYCPVSLKFAKKWVRGDVRFGAIHRGRTYLFANRENRQQFLADPDAYSPVFSGMDPVILLDSQQSVEGSRRYGYEYRGAFYLFSSAESMKKFSNQPDQYSARVRQAMNRLDLGSGTQRK